MVFPHPVFNDKITDPLFFNTLTLSFLELMHGHISFTISFYN